MYLCDSAQVHVPKLELPHCARLALAALDFGTRARSSGQRQGAPHPLHPPALRARRRNPKLLHIMEASRRSAPPSRCGQPTPTVAPRLAQHEQRATHSFAALLRRCGGTRALAPTGRVPCMCYTLTSRKLGKRESHQPVASRSQSPTLIRTPPSRQPDTRYQIVTRQQRKTERVRAPNDERRPAPAPSPMEFEINDAITCVLHALVGRDLPGCAKGDMCRCV